MGGLLLSPFELSLCEQEFIVCMFKIFIRYATASAYSIVPTAAAT